MPTLGQSEINVAPFALGTNPFGWTAPKDEAFRILDEFVAAGGNFIDTADVYSAWAPGNSGGESETILGEWLASRGNRDRVVIGTKVSQHPQFVGLGAANVVTALEASLRRLQTDHVDVYYAHYDHPETPLSETIGAFAELVDRGLVRAVGLSNYTTERIGEWLDIATAMGAPLPVVLQPHYNLLVREEFERAVRPLALQHHLAVSPYLGLAGGFLTGKYQSADDASGTAREETVAPYLIDAGLAVLREIRAVAEEHGVAPGTVALAWLRVQPSVVAPIASASQPAQVVDLVASATLALTDDQLTRLTCVSDAFAN